MSYLLPHLTNGTLLCSIILSFNRFTGWQVDQAILSEEERVVIIRFGRDYVS